MVVGRSCCSDSPRGVRMRCRDRFFVKSVAILENAKCVHERRVFRRVPDGCFRPAAELDDTPPSRRSDGPRSARHVVQMDVVIVVYGIPSNGQGKRCGAHLATQRGILPQVLFDVCSQQLAPSNRDATRRPARNSTQRFASDLSPAASGSVQKFSRETRLFIDRWHSRIFVAASASDQWQRARGKESPDRAHGSREFLPFLSQVGSSHFANSRSSSS